MREISWAIITSVSYSRVIVVTKSKRIAGVLIGSYYIYPNWDWIRRTELGEDTQKTTILSNCFQFFQVAPGGSFSRKLEAEKINWQDFKFKKNLLKRRKEKSHSKFLFYYLINIMWWFVLKKMKKLEMIKFKNFKLFR